MTNAEVFKKIFGFEPNKSNCPVVSSLDCFNCKGFDTNYGCRGSDWWNSEFKGVNNDG